MKYIILPKTHYIIKFFPNCENEEKNYIDFKNEFKKIYDKLLPEIRMFNTILCKKNEHINHRYPLNTGYYIKDYISNKFMIHIGCKYQELDNGFIKYCNRLIGIETSNVEIHKELKNNEKYELIISDYKNVIDKFNADVYYFWCGYIEDINILDDLINKRFKKGIFFVGVPQQEDKLNEFLTHLKIWCYKNKFFNIDYIPILFDEQIFPITSPTQFTIDNNNSIWNDWKTFNNMMGIMFLMKIIIN